MPSRPVRVVTQGPSEPVRVVTQGIADPVRIISDTPSDPVRVVTSGISTPVRIVAGSIPTSTPILPDVASATRLLDLQADALDLSNGDPVGAWLDASGLGNDFTQTGNARPTYRAGDGIPYVEFDGAEDWMLGVDFADSLPTMTIFLALLRSDFNSSDSWIISKIAPGSWAGWAIYQYANSFFIDDVDGVSGAQIDAVTPPNYSERFVYSVEVLGISASNFHQRYNSSVPNDVKSDDDVISDFSNTEPVRLGTANFSLVTPMAFCRMDLYAAMIYSPAPNASDRAAIEGWLAAKHGITL